MSLEVGQTIDGYELVAPLDNSRIGLAYKVRNSIAERFETLRILPPDMQNDREQADRFLREIQVHARLSHPNIVSFYHATKIDGQLAMTTELVEGITLDQKLSEGALPLEEAIDYVCQVLSALEYAHELGVVHREIAPVHIILTPDGTIKLTGFSLAKSAGDRQLTQVGTIQGWLEYMSPEQVKGISSVDARTDIYSLGVVLYELATGNAPFICNTQFDLMFAHVNTIPRSPMEINPAIPAPLSRIILTSLAKDPDDRFPTAKAFREVLETMPEGRPRAVVPPEPPTLEIPPEIADVPVQPILPTVAPEPRNRPWALAIPQIAHNREIVKLAIAAVCTFLIVAIAFFAVLRFLS